MPDVGRLPVVEDSHYGLKAEIAHGGVGRILRASDQRLERPVAIKELMERNGSAERRFVREALLTARLQHPNIVPVYEAGRWASGEPFFAMKFVCGRSLSKVIQETNAFDQRLALLPHVIAVAEAMAYAHSEGIIHRDLKPQNILVGPFGETVVIDWGLAKNLRDRSQTPRPSFNPPPKTDGNSRPAPSLDSSVLTMTGTIMGTPAYMPPEQAEGHTVDERADVYALGAVLYHLLAGHTPYAGMSGGNILREVRRAPPEPLEHLQPGVPKDLLTVVQKAMARNPEKRYRTAGELAQDLKRFQTGQIVLAHHYSRKERVLRFIRKRRIPLLISAAAFAVVALVATFSIVGVVEARDQARHERDRTAVAEQKSTERADGLTLVEAKAALSRDPLEALAWLKTLSPGFRRSRSVRWIAAEAMMRGVPRLFRDAGGAVNSTAFSPDGRWLAAASDDRKVYVRETGGSHLDVWEGHTDEVWGVVFRADGKMLISTSKDSTVRLWDVPGGESRVLSGHQGPLSDAEPLVGDQLLTRGRDGQTRLWDLKKGSGTLLNQDEEGDPKSAACLGGKRVVFASKGALFVFNAETGEMREWSGQQQRATAIACSPDGGFAVTGDGTGGIWVWELSTGHVEQLEGHEGGIRRLLFGPQGDRFFSSSDDKTVRIWRLNQKQPEMVLRGHGGVVYDLVLTPDERSVISGSADHTARIWDLSSGTSRVITGPHDGVGSVSLSSDGRWLAVASYDQTVRLYGASFLRSPVLGKHRAGALKLSVSPDDTHVTSIGRDGDILLGDIAAGGLKHVSYSGPKLNDFVYAPDGKSVVLAGENGRIMWLNFAGVIVQTWEGHEGPVKRIALMPNGKGLVSVGADGTVRRWAMETGASEIRYRAGCSATALAVSSDGTALASAFEDGSIVLLSESAGQAEKKAVLHGHHGAVLSLRFGLDAHTLVSGGADHTIRVWDGASGAPRHVLDAGGTGIYDLAFFRDGRRFLSLGGEANARIWDAVDGRRLRVLRGHQARVSVVALSPDGTRAATGSTDGMILLWDLETGENRALEGHRGAVNSLAFALGGKIILSTGEDGTVQRWDDDLPMESGALRDMIEHATPETVETLGLDLAVGP